MLERQVYFPRFIASWSCAVRRVPRIVRGRAKERCAERPSGQATSLIPLAGPTVRFDYGAVDQTVGLTLVALRYGEGQGKQSNENNDGFHGSAHAITRSARVCEAVNCRYQARTLRTPAGRF